MGARGFECPRVVLRLGSYLWLRNRIFLCLSISNYVYELEKDNQQALVFIWGHLIVRRVWNTRPVPFYCDTDSWQVHRWFTHIVNLCPESMQKWESRLLAVYDSIDPGIAALQMVARSDWERDSLHSARSLAFSDRLERRWNEETKRENTALSQPVGIERWVIVVRWALSPAQL